MSKFYFAGDSASISSDDEDNLPYPAALPRSDFLAPDFDAPSYLSSLSDRHQTLEDLRTDLWERSQALTKELSDLVNSNHEQFSNLGTDLRGGEERVEDVRVGLLGFKRGIEDVKRKVSERHWEVKQLLDEKSKIGVQITFGRKLLEVDARLEELEDKLMVSQLGRHVNDEDSWSESEDEEAKDGSTNGSLTGTSTGKLQRLVHDYRQVHQLASSIGIDHPYIIAQESRTLRIRNTLLLDLSTALKQCFPRDNHSTSRLVRIMSIYRDMDESAEAVRELKKH
jgi:hypothetical protein